jgi:hypothetical protein
MDGGGGGDEAGGWAAREAEVSLGTRSSGVEHE